MLTKGQRDDFLAYFGTGAAVLFALGGVPIVAAAAVIGACGVGAVANRSRSLESATSNDDQIELQLRSEYGDAAVERYRECLGEGMTQLVAARTAIYEELQRH
ncbi:hypothetical protein [Rosistilla oblonga]|uniref:hypothetical protein n=1 Tax=Rosistilla oblonga TaxID=2527990 RepID=UPI003A96FC90